MIASGWLSLGFAQAGFGADRRPDLIAFEPQHPGERLGDPLVVVDDEDLRGDRFGRRRWHVGYCNRRVGSSSMT